MRAVITILLCIFCMPAFAFTGYNPFMRNHDNQLSFFIGQGVNSGFIVPPPTQFVPFNIFQLQYSQPTTFFTLPARQSLNIGQTLGFADKYGWHWRDYTIPMIMISGDVLLADFNDFYFAGGAGAGLQAQQNERLGSKPLFQFKLTAGWHINDKWGTEIFVQHFSNANTAPQNYSYAFYGLGVTYNF
ncbi:MAG: acyloxyacyl hydrolase [Alphaproteobacteria bacterium]|nr:acyloxyacyl hydrolase [Alphaproteobacteria bacterium]